MNNRKQIIIAGALAAVLVAVLAYQFLFAGGVTPVVPKNTAPAGGTAVAGAPVAVKPEGTQVAQAAPKGAASGQPLELMQVDIDPDALLKDISVVPFDYQANKIDRNPMTPLIGVIRAGEAKAVATPGTAQDVMQKKVTGIIWDDHNPVAVVDDEVIGVGHAYANGVQVQAIEKDRVIFKVRDSLIPVPMKEL